MGIVEEGISFATNFLTQILTIVGGIILATRYVVTENKKSHERLSKKILGSDMDGRSGKGGLLDELRIELKKDQSHQKESLQKEIKDVQLDLNNKITDGHNTLLFEFQKTAMRINYMSRNFGRMEKTLERVTGGRYVAEKIDLNREEESYYNVDTENTGDPNGVPGDHYDKRKRGKGI